MYDEKGKTESHSNVSYSGLLGSSSRLASSSVYLSNEARLTADDILDYIGFGLFQVLVHAVCLRNVYFVSMVSQSRDLG